MKKLLILNLLYFVFYTHNIVYCQNNFIYVPASITIRCNELNKNGEATGIIKKDIITYGVDNQGNITTYSYKHNGNKKDIYYSYEGPGNKLSEIYEYENGRKNPTRKEKYSYDELGRCIKKIIELGLDGKFKVYDTTFSYDNKNNIILKTHDTGKIVFNYNSVPKLTEETSYTKENNKWLKNKMTIYKYDKKGKLLVELTKILIDNKWIDNERCTYKYDKLGNRIYELYESVGFGDDSELEEQSYINYKYDKHGKNLIQEDWFSFVSDNTITRYFEYDKRGLLVKVNVKSKLKQSGEIQPYWIFLFGNTYEGFQADIDYFEIPTENN